MRKALVPLNFAFLETCFRNIQKLNQTMLEIKIHITCY